MAGKTSYFAVKCKVCGNLIPLREFSSEYAYGLPDSSFLVRHNEQVPSVRCQALDIYDIGDIDRHDISPVADLRPHPDITMKKR